MTHVICRLTAKARDQLRNPMLGNLIWATFTFNKQTKEKTTTLSRLSAREGEEVELTAADDDITATVTEQDDEVDDNRDEDFDDSTCDKDDGGAERSDLSLSTLPASVFSSCSVAALSAADRLEFCRRSNNTWHTHTHTYTLCFKRATFLFFCTISVKSKPILIISVHIIISKLVSL